RMTRDWTFVSDTVAGVVAAVDAPLGFEIVNLGRGEPVLVSHFIQEFERLTGKKVPCREVPKPQADVDRTHADIEKARRLLKYDPKIDVHEGARRALEWYERSVAKLGPA
ncbi:MAG TPA: hypothetical protein VGQ57_20800, partial [Polyangiaceae bacterium]|nr:hypothetical protein [Polyangiaceae bacterium]